MEKNGFSSLFLSSLSGFIALSSLVGVLAEKFILSLLSDFISFFSSGGVGSVNAGVLLFEEEFIVVLIRLVEAGEMISFGFSSFTTSRLTGVSEPDLFIFIFNLPEEDVVSTSAVVSSMSMLASSVAKGSMTIFLPPVESSSKSSSISLGVL